MKQLLSVQIFLFLLTGSLMAQNQKEINSSGVVKQEIKSESKPVKVTVTSVNESARPIHLSSTTTQVNNDQKKEQEVKPDSGTNLTVEYYDSMINAIKTKVEWVKNNPEEHKKAIASGWYDQMEKQIQEFEKLKQGLTR